MALSTYVPGRAGGRATADAARTASDAPHTTAVHSRLARQIHCSVLALVIDDIKSLALIDDLTSFLKLNVAAKPRQDLLQLIEAHNDAPAFCQRAVSLECTKFQSRCFVYVSRTYMAPRKIASCGAMVMPVAVHLSCCAPYRQLFCHSWRAAVAY